MRTRGVMKDKEKIPEVEMVHHLKVKQKAKKLLLHRRNQRQYFRSVLYMYKSFFNILRETFVHFFGA